MDIRRHLGVPFAGVNPTGLTMGIRTLFQAGQLEFYMQNLQPAEEAVLLGKAFGALRIYGNPVAGQVLSISINGTAITYTVTAADILSTSPLQSIANNFSNAINLSAVSNIFSGGFAILPPTPQAQLPGFGAITLVPAVSGVTFTLTAPGVTGPAGLTLAMIADGTTLPFPNTAFIDGNGNTITLVGYLNYCNYFEANIAVASPNMAFMSAGGKDVAVFRPYEMRQRIEMYNYWREAMGRKLSVGSDAWGFRGNNGSGQGGSSA